MFKIRLSAVAMVLAALLPASAGAVSLDVNGTRLSVNGYLDLQYTYMDRMPMGMGMMVMPMDSVSTLDQDHLNLIFQVVHDNVVANVNLQSRRAFQAGVESGGTVDGHGEWEVLEAYGEYQFSDRYKVRGGEFLAPFGFYNHMRFAIALFAPVVLPTLYEPPPNYARSGGLDHLVPDAANLMVHGTFENASGEIDYALYTGSGHRNATGVDSNETKNLGAKVEGSFGPGTVGVSGYWANDGDAFGDRLHLAASLEVDMGNLTFQGEVLDISTSTDAADVLSYYGRFSYWMGRTTPFIGYDYLEDDGNLVYMGGMQRWSLGVGHELTSSVFLKAEYHRHIYDGAAIPSSVETVDMVRLAAILVF
jgi:hypothetical protein